MSRVLFMGTPDFAVPVLNALVRSGYEVCAVVTQPDKPTGRRQRLTSPPVKVAAQALGLVVLQPVRVRQPEALQEIAALQPDVIVTAAYGQLLPQALLDIPRVGCLNIHASLLPRWRGAAPIHRALLAGDTTTGVTIMEMVLSLDAGPIVAQESMDIYPTDNVEALHNRLAALGADMLVDVLPRYLDGELPLRAQPEEGVTYAGKITAEDERIDWNQSAVAVFNQIRGLSPWPVARTSYNGQPLKVWDAQLPKEAPPEFPGQTDPMPPGQVVFTGKEVLVKCRPGWLQLIQVQPAGKRSMAAADWLRGVTAKTVQLGAGQL